MKVIIRVNMIKFEKMLVAFFICALMITNIIQVNANFSKSMYLTWGAQHASIVGEDLHLVLDKTSGEKIIFTMHQFWFQQVSVF